jgi:DNA replication protein DnaC
MTGKSNRPRLRPEMYQDMISLRDEILDSCPSEEDCRNGYLPYPREGYPGQVNRCVCGQVAHYLTELIEAGIPRAYWWLSISDLNIDPDVVGMVKNYIKKIRHAVRNGLGLMFMGANGVGKTSLMSAIGKAAVVTGHRVKYFTAQQYIEAKKTSDELVEEFESAKVILLDELDKVYVKSGSNYVPKTLEDFIRRMTSAGATFVICTNHDERTLQEVFGQSTYSMLLRHLKLIQFTGDDFSDRLQSRWDERLDDETDDYFHPHIVAMAKTLDLWELEDERKEWEKVD